MNNTHRDFEDKRRELAADLAADADTPQVDPPAKPPLPPLTVRPGSHWAAAAYRAGREDEYIDAMQSRYGDEW